MLTVEEARERILAAFTPLDAEDVPLTEAVGRVLAEDAVAGETLPPFANSAMDGYALRAEDTASATGDAPARLRLSGESAAGRLFEGHLGPGETARIFTGAAVPDGADAVIQQENVAVEDGTLLVREVVSVGNNVRAAGSDVRQGALLIPAGETIGTAEIALLAALGVHPVRVRRRPRVAILATGDELAPLGEVPRPGQIRDSNSIYLAAVVARAGGEPLSLGIARDNADELRQKLSQAQESDLILTSGGVSVGDYDLVKQILEEQGNIAFWRVRVRPGKPLAFGLLGKTPLLGLPGNPVSAAVTFELFGRPAIRRMLGAAQVERPLVEVVLEDDVERGDRRHYVRAWLDSHGGTLVARTTGNQGSHVISSLRGATALLVIPEGEGIIRAGEHVQAVLLNDNMPWAED